MKGLFLTMFMCVLFTLNVKATTYTSNAGGTGSWDTSTDWVGNNNPPTSGIQNDDIYISASDSIVRNGNLTFNNNNFFSINGIVTITGNMVINNNLELAVNTGGKLYILGSLDVKNNADFTIEGGGEVIVTGDVDFGNGTTGTVDGNLSVGGDFTVGSGTIDGTGTIDAPNSNICSDASIDVTDLNCGDADNPLPVSIEYFNSKIDGRFVYLNWSTSFEENFDYFSIERSKDGKHFSEISRIYSRTQYSEVVKGYNYSDELPLSGLSYYRLKATDFDGFTEYHGIVRVKLDDIEDNLSIYPNPGTGDHISVNFNGGEDSGYSIMSLTGQIVDRGFLKTGINEIQFSERLKPGIYFLNREGLYKAATRFIVK